MELEMLKTIIEKTLGRNMDAITEKTTFVDDLGVDSLDFFQILIDLEELLMFVSTRRKPRRSLLSAMQWRLFAG